MMAGAELAAQNFSVSGDKGAPSASHALHRDRVAWRLGGGEDLDGQDTLHGVEYLSRCEKASGASGSMAKAAWQTTQYASQPSASHAAPEPYSSKK